MQWLETMLAFSVVMMFLSTMVTVVVEAIHYLLKFRQDGLQRLVGQFYNDIIVPSIQKTAKANLSSAEPFTKQLTQVRYQPVSSSSWQVTKRLRTRFISSTYLNSLSALEFVERFAETPEGQALYHESKKRGEDILAIQIENIVSKFEEYGEHTREYFSKRAQFISIFVSIILAIALNLHAVEIVKALFVDSDARTYLLTQAKTLEPQLAQLSEQNDEQLALQLENFKSMKAQLEKSSIPFGWDDPVVPSLFFTVIGAKRCKPALQATTESSMPSTQAATKLSSETTNSDTENEFYCQIVKTGQWLLSILFTGLLIGLGGPFWFNAYKKLMSFTSIARGMQSTVQKSKGNALLNEQSSNATKVFEQAVIAYQLNH